MGSVGMSLSKFGAREKSVYVGLKHTFKKIFVMMPKIVYKTTVRVHFSLLKSSPHVAKQQSSNQREMASIEALEGIKAEDVVGTNHQTPHKTMIWPCNKGNKPAFSLDTTGYIVQWGDENETRDGKYTMKLKLSDKDIASLLKFEGEMLSGIEMRECEGKDEKAKATIRDARNNERSRVNAEYRELMCKIHLHPHKTPAKLAALLPGDKTAVEIPAEKVFDVTRRVFRQHYKGRKADPLCMFEMQAHVQVSFVSSSGVNYEVKALFVGEEVKPESVWSPCCPLPNYTVPCIDSILSNEKITAGSGGNYIPFSKQQRFGMMSDDNKALQIAYNKEHKKDGKPHQNHIGLRFPENDNGPLVLEKLFEAIFQHIEDNRGELLPSLKKTKRADVSFLDQINARTAILPQTAESIDKYGAGKTVHMKAELSARAFGGPTQFFLVLNKEHFNSSILSTDPKELIKQNIVKEINVEEIVPHANAYVVAELSRVDLTTGINKVIVNLRARHLFVDDLGQSATAFENMLVGGEQIKVVQNPDNDTLAKLSDILNNNDASDVMHDKMHDKKTDEANEMSDEE